MSENEEHPQLLVDQLVAEYIDRLIAGESVDPSDVEATHPDLASEILPQLDTFLNLGAEFNAGSPLGTLGDYTLRRQIGRGGMAVVYEAWQNSVDRPVALKVLPAGVAADERALQRFVREAKTAAQLNHPNIVSVHGMGVEKDTPYYAMEHVQGETMAEVLARLKGVESDSETPFGKKNSVVYFGRLAEAFADVADGLQHAHSKGVIHRDVKPSNLILDDEGRLRVLDFGLARLEGQEDLTLSGDLVGTPVYMSPEQAKRRKVPIDHRTDIYSLGATLYEVLTCQPPLRGKDHMDTLSRIIERAPWPPRQLNPGVPQDLETIVLKCLRKEAVDRYATAEALGQDLRRFVRGHAIEARPESRVEKTVRVLTRHRKAVATATALLVLGVLALLVGSGFILRAERRALENYNLAARRLTESRWQTYRANIGAVGFHLDGGDFVEGGRLLDACPVEFRGWEWNHFKLRSARCLLALDGQGGEVTAVTFSPDGKRIASGHEDLKVRLWHSGNGRLLTTLAGHERAIRGLAFTPDSELLVSAADDATIRLWNVKGEHLLRTLRGHEAPIYSMALSPDGRRIASASLDSTVRLWDVETGRRPLTLRHGERAYAVAFSPDGSRLVSGGAGRNLYLWEAATGKRLHRLRGHSARVFSVAFSPAGTRIASGSKDRTVRLWDAKSGQCLHVLRDHTRVIRSVAWSPDGSRLASGGLDAVLRLWDPQIGELLETLPGHVGAIYGVAFSPDGERVASAARDAPLRVWTVRGESAVSVLRGHEKVVWSVACSSDGKLIASGSADRSVRLWDAQTGVPQAILPGHDGVVSSVAFSPTENLVASGSKDATVRLWDVKSKRVLETFDHPSQVWSVAFSPDGRHIASGAEDGTLRLWDTQTGELVSKLRSTKGSRVFSIAYSPDGKTLLSARDGGGWVRAWNIRAEKPFFEVRVRGGPSGPTVCFSPNGERIAASSGTNVEVWNLRRRERDATLRGHTSLVGAVAYSPDAKRLVSASDDGTIRLWDAATGEPVATLRGHESKVLDVVFCPDGKSIVSASVDNTVRVWQSEKPWLPRPIRANLEPP